MPALIFRVYYVRTTLHFLELHCFFYGWWSKSSRLMSLIAHQFGHVEFWIFFFQLHLPLENNNKYSKFEVQSSTLPNLYLYKITSFPPKVAAYMRVLPTSWSQLVFDASTFIRTSWSLTFLEQDSHQQNQVHRHMQLQLGQRFFLQWRATKLLPQPCNPLHPGQKDKVVHSKDQLSLVQHLQPCVLNQWLLFPSRRYSLHQSVKKIVGKVIIGERFNIRRYLKAKVPHLVVYLAIYNLKVSKYLVHTIKVKIRVNLLLHVLENYKMFSNFFESFSLKIF